MYSREGGSAELLSGRRFGEITLGEVVRPNYYPESGSGKVLSGRWFGRITLHCFPQVFLISLMGNPPRPHTPPRTPRGALRIRTENERFSSAPSASEKQRFRSTERASEAQISLLVPCGGEKQKLLQR